MKVLLIDCEKKIINTLRYFLEKNGYVVDGATDGETGIEMACTSIYDVIVLERLLPDQDGLSLLKEFRSLGHDTPVLFLTAKDHPEDRVEGLNASADDYVTKPFFAEELLARLQALTRRKNKELAENILITDEFVLDPQRSQVIKNNKVIQLTLKEAQLLELLILNCGRVVTKERIIQKVWGFNADTQLTTIKLYIHHLRKKLHISNLKTVRGIGYSLQDNKAVSQIAN